MTYDEITKLDKYKYLFKLAEETSISYPIKFGLECGVGWHNILLELIQEIGHIDIHNNTKLFQIKSKFGALRCYVQYDENIPIGISNTIDDIIKRYETKCWNTCELCGKTATHTNKGWITRVCEEHISE